MNYCYDNLNLSLLSNCLSRQRLPFYPVATATVSMATTLFLRGDRPARQEPVGFRTFHPSFSFFLSSLEKFSERFPLTRTAGRSESNQTGTFLSSTFFFTLLPGQEILNWIPAQIVSFSRQDSPEFCGHPRQMQLLSQFIVQHLYDISDFLGI